MNLVPNNHKYPLGVDRILTDPARLHCVMLGKAGGHHKAIAAETGLTVAMVKYWLKVSKTSVRDYRNFKSEESKIMVRHARKVLNGYVCRQLEQLKQDRQKQLAESAVPK